MFVSFNVKYPETKLNSPRDVLNCMRDNYQFSFLSNIGKADIIHCITPATFSYAEGSFSALGKLKT